MNFRSNTNALQGFFYGFGGSQLRYMESEGASGDLPKKGVFMVFGRFQDRNMGLRGITKGF